MDTPTTRTTPGSEALPMDDASNDFNLGTSRVLEDMLADKARQLDEPSKGNLSENDDLGAEEAGGHFTLGAWV